MSSDHNSNRKLLRQIFLLLCLGLAGIPVYGQPPTNFSRELVADKLNEAISMAFLPSGEVLLLQKGGDIKLADPTGTPPVSLSNFMTVSNINTFGEHGLIAIAVDPNYSTNKYFYLYYTPGDINGQHAKERVSRFVDTGNPVTRLSSEQMIWESNEPWQGCCHTGGTLVFGGDGALYLVTGDDFDPNRSQQLNRAGGKAHRFFPDGSTPTDNPFYDGTPGMFNANGQIQTIYSYGIRNPFRGTYDPVTDRIFFSEVGGNNHQYAFEDVHVLQKGANFGWPGCGDSGSGRDAQGNCTNPSYVDPIFTYPHAGGGACVMGGPVYQGSSYPASYNGVYFYGDYVRQFIRYLTFDANDNVNGNFLFDPSAGKIVCLEQGPDGNLYYLMVRTGTNTSLGQGRLYRYTYASQNARPTCVNSSASVTTGTGPTLNVTFNGTVTDPEGDPLTYLWTFDDGNTQSGNVPANGILPAITHTYGKGTYQATLTVSDAFGSATCDPISIQVGIPPTATITSPADSSFFKAGQTLTFTGSGTDPDGSLSNSNYRWFVNLYNGGVIHPRQGPDVGSTTTFTVPTINHVPFLGNTGYVV
ncbi:MAG: PQQ-dependent sugar dehydrogenase, partial [Bacteroidota bacterium]